MLAGSLGFLTRYWLLVVAGAVHGSRQHRIAASLESDGRALDYELLLDWWSAATRAGTRLGRSDQVGLDRWRKAVRCLAAHLVTITSPNERSGVRRAIPRRA